MLSDTGYGLIGNPAAADAPLPRGGSAEGRRTHSHAQITFTETGPAASEDSAAVTETNPDRSDLLPKPQQGVRGKAAAMNKEVLLCTSADGGGVELRDVISDSELALRSKKN